MKDDQGKTIRVDDIVTVNETGRPRTLQGKVGQVISLGEKTLKVRIRPVEPFLESRIVYIDPSMLRVGEHDIPLFGMDDVWAQERIRRLVVKYIESQIDNMVREKIILPEQRERLVGYLEARM